MRCPNCNKFVSYDDPQCETNSVELDGNSVRASVTVQLNCAECGTTLKDAEIESDVEIEHECGKDAKIDPEIKDDDQFEIENEGESGGTNRVQTIDRNGKPIKSSRYMKTFYGFELETQVKCLKCGETFEVQTSGEEQASGFNECC